MTRAVKCCSAPLALVAGCLLLGVAAWAPAQSAAGYAEYYIPGYEDTMWLILDTLDDAGTTPTPMHTVIAVTAWAPVATVYYDHWEDGYDFDPANPATADETQVLATTGARYSFESSNIPLPRTTQATCSPALPCPYDGHDRLFVAGGTVTVTRAGGLQSRWAGNQAVAWEIYPVKPQLTTYVLPFGENLYVGDATNFHGFERVFAMVQATADSTSVTVDVNADGAADVLNLNRNATWNDSGDGTVVSLDAGETFLLDQVSACRNHANCLTAPGTLNTGAVITGTATLQVKFIAGFVGEMYCARGLSAFPRGYWTKDYYAPFGQGATAGRNTDYYLYNPGAAALPVSWQSLTGSGSFTINPGQTRSYRQAVGTVPQGSGLYFSAPEPFWGVGFGDSGADLFEWGFSLLPSTLLYTEHFLGWAPGSLPVGSLPLNGNGAYLSCAQDNTSVFVDVDANGTADQTYTLSRLQSQFISDPDGDLSGARIWATAPFTMAYGQNPDTATTPTPNLDLGYVAIPGADFISLVLSVDKGVSPVVISTASGSTAEFTITVSSQKYTVDEVLVLDNLASSWAYTPGSTTITRADLSQSTAEPTVTAPGADLPDPFPGSCPTAAGPCLTWPDTVLGDLAENQQITVVFEAHTTSALGAGTLSQNKVTATGTRTVGGVEQTFNATDFAYNVSGAFTIAKTTSPTGTVSPGDTITYTVTLTDPAGAPAQHGISLYDALPEGVTSVAGTTTLGRSTVADSFSSRAYNLNAGTRSWSGNWAETNDGAGGATGGDILVTNPAGELQLDNSNSREPTISRAVSTSGATSAVLSFSYRTGTGVDSTDVFRVRASTGGVSGTFTTILDLNGITGATSGWQTLDISSYIGANTAIRFTFPNNSYEETNEFIYVDNVSITYDVSVTGANPPDLLSSSNLYTLTAGQSLSVSFQVTVDDPFPTGLDTLTNVASTTTIELPIANRAEAENSVLVPSVLSASVGDRVWLDVDGDGVQDVGEPGLANVEVTLKDRFGTPVAVAVTSSTGHFLFTDVAPGTGYYIEVTDGLPAGLTQSYPGGHADNRTDAFPLVDGQVDTTRDLGFRAAAGTATFGDRAWVDADSDQVQDPGEIGLGGVTVTLYLDNGDGVLGAGDTQVGSPVTTAPDGSYLFTGVTASGTQTYFVAATGPAGYAATGVTTYRFQTVAAGSVLVTADFGFVGDTVTTYTIEDRVWADYDGDKLVGAGENGIAGVTVELLDASGNVIGTTTTAADGTFSFSGVAGGGADYTVRISDNGGVLADFAGTTTYAVAGERAEDNLSGNVDHTAAPSYGYRPLRAIGDLLYHDVSNFGVWDSGEPGIAGVVVSLFRDLDSDGVVDSTVPCPNGANDCLLGTVTSTASGGYLFSGLSNGSYIVSVPVQTGYTFRGPGSDSDATRPGVQKAVTLSGPNRLDIDYGYSADAPRAISGTVWNDLDADGVIDPGEGGYEGVTLEIVSGGVVVATVTTGPTGTYSISGLAAGSYTVRLTDTAGILVGLLETYEKTEGTTGPFNYQEVADASVDDVPGVSFGFRKQGPTYASVAGFRAGVSARGVVVEWRTTAESGTLGFNVLRRDPVTGRYRQVNERLLPGLLVRPEGGVYRFLDSGAAPGKALSYTLEEVAVGGTRRTSGPYVVRPSTDLVLDAGEGGFVREPAALSAEEVARLGVLEQERAAAASRKASLTGPVLKVTTGQAGLTYLPTTELAARLARPEKEVAARLRSGSLALGNRGKPVPYLPAPGEAGLYFLAEPSPTVYSSGNVYWLTGEPGVLMGASSPSSALKAVAAFPETLHLEQEQHPLPRYFSDPEGDFWCWEYLVAGYSGLDRKSFAVPVPGVFNLSAATLTVDLQGGSETAASFDHHVLVSWNGVAVGEARWDGTLPHRLVIPLARGAVLEGANTLELVAVLDPGVAFSVVYLDSLDLVYNRVYRAVGNELAFSAPGNAEVIVPGFSSASVVVLDVTTPSRPLQVRATVGPAADGSYQVRFGTPSGKVSRRYLATETGVARAPVVVTAFQSAGLADGSNRADYLLVAPASLVEAAEALAQHRRAQGLDTRVVDLESVYDEFNHGLPSPWAIQSFLHHAATAWDGAPTAATLVGRGTYDYLNWKGVGDNLLPPLLAATPYGLAVSDTRIADWTGDGAPELALGRLPCVTSQEVADYLAKIVAYEGAAADPLRVLLAADDPDASGSFPADSNAVSAFVPPGFQVDKVYLTTYTAETGKQAILGAVNAGVLLFNYIGHGGLDHLADEVLLHSDDVAAMTNATQLPVFVGMTCSVGNFGMPGFPSLAETMVRRTGGGALAVWAASGLSDNAEAVELNKAFFRAVFVDGERVVGQVVFRALHSPEAQGAPRFMKEIYNLLGEPVSALP